MGALPWFFRVDRDLDHHVRLALSPWRIWNSQWHGIDAPAEAEPLFRGEPGGPALLAEIRALAQLGAVRTQEWRDREARLEIQRESSPIPAAILADDLREAQRAALEASGSGHPKLGLYVLAGGSGKTRLGLEWARRVGGALVLAPNAVLREQWRAEAKKWKLFQKGGKLDPKLLIESTEILRTGIPEKSRRPLLLIDEAHGLSVDLLQILTRLEAPCIGLTATPSWDASRDELFFTAFGPCRFPLPSVTTAPSVHATCLEIRVPMDPSLRSAYLLSRSVALRHQVASANPFKESRAAVLVKRHPGGRILILGEFVEPLERVAARGGFPLVTGKTTPAGRRKAYAAFNGAKAAVLVSSGVTDEGIDLPEADVVIQLSGGRGDTVQELQRLGRLLRPKDRPVVFYSLVSENTAEEESARQRRGSVERLGIPYEVQGDPLDGDAPEDRPEPPAQAFEPRIDDKRS
ncbi:MAG: hypothetical protein J0L75_21570 [Spirochaetes bacterium]|nr:hypothetical protein [Spirochaetota bacterium]